jgi:chaperone required for assembly of F1-ATPase
VSEWRPKRFWTSASAEAVPGGFEVRLDARSLKTPGKHDLILPTRALAEAIAAEWDAQQGQIKPSRMPMTRFANSAVEKVAPQFDAVVGEVAGYGASDLLCYRATAPRALIDRQAAGWDPLLAWAAQTLGAPLTVTSGVMPVAQPQTSLATLRAAVAAATPFQLVALHDLVAISGSLVLGLAVAQGRLEAETAFALSRIDEHWQAELWGPDEEATAMEARKHADFAAASRFHLLCS